MEATRLRIADHPPGFTPTPGHPSRSVAGLLLAAHKQRWFAILGGSGRVDVPSAGGEFLLYAVDDREGTCTCPDYRYGAGYRKGFCKHIVAAEFFVSWAEACERLDVPHVLFSVEPRHDSRLGDEIFGVIERSDDYPTGRCWSTALALEVALMDIVDIMQDLVAEAGVR